MRHVGAAATVIFCVSLPNRPGYLEIGEFGGEEADQAHDREFPHRWGGCGKLSQGPLYSEGIVHTVTCVDLWLKSDFFFFG